MAFKDRLVYCETARRTFFDTVHQQRERAGRGEPADAPVLCSICRAKVGLAAVPPDEHAEEGDIAISALVLNGCAFGAADMGLGRSQSAGGNRREPAGGDERPAGGGNAERSRGQRGGRGGGRRDGGRSGGGRGERGGGGRQRGARQSGSGRRGRREEVQTELRIRHEGTVKWFNDDKGYGFIAQDDGSDLFMHMSSVLGPQGIEIYEGLPVEYEIETAARGQQAVYVVPLA